MNYQWKLNRRKSNNTYFFEESGFDGTGQGTHGNIRDDGTGQESPNRMMSQRDKNSEVLILHLL